jgi:sortase B
VQTEDNEYYLSHDFDKNEDSNGTLFVDSRCDLVNPTTNTIIYGHNMKSGLMFGSLKSYLDEDYYNDHKTIHFSTLYEDRTYEIVAVCLSKVAYQDDDSYRYYNFIDAASDSEFQAFYENVQSLSVYGTDVDLSSDDQLLTLSTCNSYVEDGRLFLVAKRVE